MLEQREEICVGVNSSIIENYTDLNRELSLKYPQMILHRALDEYDLQGRKTGMNKNEREFARLLIRRNFLVYREPEIRDCNRIPDFFVLNPRSGVGKLVEITLFFSDSIDNRKRQQIAELESCGIPFVVLYREQMENIKRYVWRNLFDQNVV